MKEKTEQTHTPGPWIASATKSQFGSWGIFTQAGMYSILDGSAPHGRAESNAKLIAVAPDLLAALTTCADWLARSTRIDDREIAEDARAAIAKATGK